MGALAGACRFRLSAAMAATLMAAMCPSAHSAKPVPGSEKPQATAFEATPDESERRPPVPDDAADRARRPALRRERTWHGPLPPSAPQPSHEHLHWIVAGQGDDVELVAAQDVRFFKSDNKYTRVATGEHDVLIRKTIRELAEALDPDVFWQIHRSAIVNVNQVASVGHAPNGGLVLRLKDRREILPVSPRYAHRFHRM